MISLVSVARRIFQIKKNRGLGSSPAALSGLAAPLCQTHTPLVGDEAPDKEPCQELGVLLR